MHIYRLDVIFEMNLFWYIYHEYYTCSNATVNQKERKNEWMNIWMNEHLKNAFGIKTGRKIELYIYEKM